MCRGSSFVAAIALLAIGAGSARASSIVVAGGDAISGSPGAAGLNGAIYQNTANPTASISATNDNLALNDLLSFRSANTQTATYRSTQAAGGTIAYSGLDTTATRSFLGSDATNGAFTPAGLNTQLDTTLVDLTGYIDVQAAGDYVFSVGSDDAAYLLIDGQQVLSNGGLHYVSGASGDAYFNAAGLYSFELIYANEDFNNSSGQASLNFTAPAGTTLFAPLNDSLTPAAASTPVPSSALGGLALIGGLVVVRLGRRVRPA